MKIRVSVRQRLGREMLLRHCSVSKGVYTPSSCRVRSAIPKENENDTIVQNTTEREINYINQEE